MKAFWKLLATGLVKGALWCAEHPDEITAIVAAAKAKK
jgi:ABC-type nitrate/sulfonate/bicarbonate transport system substrate-binding protein